MVKRDWIVLAILPSITAMSAIAGICWNNQKPPQVAPTDFICRSPNGQTFIIGAEINSADRLDKREVLKVFSRVFDKTFEVGSTYQLCSAIVQRLCFENGTWITEPERTYITQTPIRGPQGGQVGYATKMISIALNATLNPVDHTVLYNTRMRTSH
jgi:hypothetical protein